MGVSRRIAQIPRGFEIGQWVLLAHRKACYWPAAADPTQLSGVLLAFSPGIFQVWQPSRIEYVVTGGESDAELEAWRRRGVEPVEVVHAVGVSKPIEFSGEEGSASGDH